MAHPFSDIDADKGGGGGRRHMTTSQVREGAATGMAEEIQEHAQPPKALTWVGNVRHFLREVSLEMKKVSWPTRTEVTNTTIVVIIAVFFFAFYLFGTDLVLSYLIEGIEWLAQKVFV
jgi:preprotein translocase subunit SecE